MTKSQSIYLDLVRLVAALGVYFNHATKLLFPLPTWLGEHGSESVAAFFVLSGYVIAYVSRSKEASLSSYLVARAARVCSVAWIAIVVAIAFDALGTAINPAFYEQLPDYGTHSLLAALTYFTFTNELWFTHIIFGSNNPYWSLGFEVQYYIAFAIMSYSEPRARVLRLAIWALIVGPKILIYFPLWLLGCLTFKITRELQRRKCPTIIGAIAFLASFAIYGPIFHEYYFTPMYSTGFWHPPLLTLGYFYVVGLAVALNLIDFVVMTQNMPASVVFPGIVERAIRWFAGASFTLYLAHSPDRLLRCCRVPDIKNNRWKAPRL